MVIQSVNCPACFAPITINEGSTVVVCEYCGTSSAVERSPGHSSTLVMRTVQASIERNAEQQRVSSLQLLIAQLGASIATLRSDVLATDAEIREIQRGKMDSTARRQIQALSSQKQELSRSLRELLAQHDELTGELKSLREPETTEAAEVDVAPASLAVVAHSPEKSKGLAVALALFPLTGLFGLHHFYTGNWKLGLVYALFFWTYIPILAAWLEGFSTCFVPNDEWQARKRGIIVNWKGAIVCFIVLAVVVALGA